MRTTDKNGQKMFWKSATSQKLNPSDKAKVMVILYVSQLKEGPIQSCFSMTEKGSVWKACMCLWAFTVFIERGGREKDQKEMEADVWRDAELTPSAPLIHPKSLQSGPSWAGSAISQLSFSAFASFCARALLQRALKPPSLLILPKDVVLFALHVLKVKVGPSHAFVDVLDVIASGLKVSRGIVGAWGKDLKDKVRIYDTLMVVW